MDLAERFEAMLDEPGKLDALRESAGRRAEQLLALGRLWVSDRQAQVAGDDDRIRELQPLITDAEHELGLGKA